MRHEHEWQQMLQGASPYAVISDPASDLLLRGTPGGKLSNVSVPCLRGCQRACKFSCYSDNEPPPHSKVAWARLFSSGYDTWLSALRTANDRVHTGPDDQALRPVIAVPGEDFRRELSDATVDFTQESVLKAWVENHRKVIQAAVRGTAFPWSIYRPDVQVHLVGTRIAAAEKGQKPRAPVNSGEACRKWNAGDCGDTCTLAPPRAHKCSKCGGAHRATTCQQGNQ